MESAHVNFFTSLELFNLFRRKTDFKTFHWFPFIPLVLCSLLKYSFRLKITLYIFYAQMGFCLILTTKCRNPQKDTDNRFPETRIANYKSRLYPRARLKGSEEIF